ncbi:MAG: hypothetical protein K2X37_02555, partial [Chitinophagaceae bacterium]|nr:hypothetical protein [Chitinophagaceae bacterium]
MVVNKEGSSANQKVFCDGTIRMKLKVNILLSHTITAKLRPLKKCLIKSFYKKSSFWSIYLTLLLGGLFFIFPARAQNTDTNTPADFNVSLQEDSMLGTIGQVKSLFSFNEDQAAALELDGGTRVLRLNGTYGFALNDTNRIKFTTEYLLENLDFSFYTGDTRQWVDQGAIGASYQYLLDNDTFKNLAIGSHYSHAPNKSLSDKTITYSDGSTLTDYRRIAGGDDWNGTAETALHLWPRSLLTVGGDYDRVRYDTEYCTQDGHDAQGFGGHLRLQQLLKSNTQLEAQSTLSQLVNTYGASLNWMWTSTTKTVLSAGLNSSYTQDHTTERNFWVNGISLNVAWDVPQTQNEKPHYAEPEIATQNLSAWVQTPAVRMPDVLAISDECVKSSSPAFTPISGVCPAGANVQYDSITQTYSASGGWFQSYPQGPAGSARVIAFDSANIMANPSGEIACLYLLNGSASRTIILKNNTFKNVAGVGTDWAANGTSQFWPT